MLLAFPVGLFSASVAFDGFPMDDVDDLENGVMYMPLTKKGEKHSDLAKK